MALPRPRRGWVGEGSEVIGFLKCTAETEGERKFGRRLQAKIRGGESKRAEACERTDKPRPVSLERKVGERRGIGTRARKGGDRISNGVPDVDDRFRSSAGAGGEIGPAFRIIGRSIHGV